MTHDLAPIILRWYAQHKRDLPWRRTTDPYKLWLSEVILQQTGTENSKAFYLKKRKDKDIWKNLYDFISVESKGALADPLDALHLLQQEGWLKTGGYKIGLPSHPYRHQLTHLRITAYFIPVYLDKKPELAAKNSLLLIAQNELNNYPVSRLMAMYFKEQEIIH